MKLALGADHAGFQLKVAMGDVLRSLGHDVLDVGAFNENPSDYPDFAEAVGRPEVAAPTRPRVFTSAVTSNDDRDQGRPSAWSSTVDRLAADYDGNGLFPRLFVLCAGRALLCRTDGL